MQNAILEKVSDFIQNDILPSVIDVTLHDVIPLAVAHALGKITSRGGIQPSPDREWKQYFVDMVISEYDLAKIHNETTFDNFIQKLKQGCRIAVFDQASSWFYLNGIQQGTMLSHYCDGDCERYCIVENHDHGDECDCELTCSLAKNAVEVPYEDTLPMDGIFSLQNLKKIPHRAPIKWADIISYHLKTIDEAAYIGIVEHRLFDLLKRTTPEAYYFPAGQDGTLLSSLGWNTILCGDMEITHESHCPEGQLIGYKKNAVSFVYNAEPGQIWRWTELRACRRQAAWATQLLIMANWIFEDPASCFVLTDIPRHL